MNAMFEYNLMLASVSERGSWDEYLDPSFLVRLQEGL